MPRPSHHPRPDSPTGLRKDALAIFKAALTAADPVEAIHRHLRFDGSTLTAGRRRYRLDRGGRVFVVGAGKATARMAVAVEQLLGKRIHSGAINVKDGHTAKLRRIAQNECSHPVPDARGVAGAQAITRLLDTTAMDDLVIVLISGGASALLPLPVPPITLEAKQHCTGLLLSSGARIAEINAVRKHISSIKGGQLAARAMPARVLALMLSDVIGDDLDVIGSGPTAPDRSTFADALASLERYRLTGKVSRDVLQHLKSGAGGRHSETPKSDHPAFARTQNLIVGSCQLALTAAAAHARKLGYRTAILSSSIAGETREVAGVHAAIAREIRAWSRPVRPPACVISGGETTVTLQGNGLGGRNQEFALAAALDIAELEGTLIASLGTDGTDGPTDAAGAFADSATCSRARKLGLDPEAFLRDNNSYPFFNALGDLIRTGPTNTNVMDVRLILSK